MSTMVDASERLQVLLTQEATFYKTSDYLSTRMQSAPEQQSSKPTPMVSGSSSSSDAEATPPNKKRTFLLSTTTADMNYLVDDNSSESPKALNSGAASTTSSSEGGSLSLINKHWREKICSWAYQVADHFDLPREVVSISMSHLDRYLACCTHDIDKNRFQLLSMTCLYLAIKLNEYKPLFVPGSVSTMDTILQLSGGFFTLEQMERMENDILQRLQWHVHPPTPQLFVKHFLLFLSTEEQVIQDLSQFIVELSVLDYFFVCYKPSEVALAALLNAMDEIFPKRGSQIKFPFQSQLIDLIKSPTVLACRERLALIVYAHANGCPDPSRNRLFKDETEPKEQRTTSPVSAMPGPSTPLQQQHNFAAQRRLE